MCQKYLILELIAGSLRVNASITLVISGCTLPLVQVDEGR